MDKTSRVDQYGLRVNYRFVGSPEVFAHDITGTDKGQRADEFVATLGKTDYCAISVFSTNE